MSTPWILAVVAGWLALLVLAFVVLGVLRRVAVVLESAERAVARSPEFELGAPAASVVPRFTVFDTSRPIGSNDLLAAGLTLLLFVKPGCPACDTLLGQLRDVGASVAGMPLRVIVDGALDALDIPPELVVFHDRDHEATRAFRNLATPQVFVVADNGFVLDRQIPGSLAELIELVDHARGGGLQPEEPTLVGTRT